MAPIPFRRVIGVAIDAAEEPFRTFEVLLLEGNKWKAKMLTMANRCERELAVTAQRHQPPHHRSANEGPSARLQLFDTRRLPAQEGSIWTKRTCPCQSGRKFKHWLLDETRN